MFEIFVDLLHSGEDFALEDKHDNLESASVIVTSFVKYGYVTRKQGKNFVVYPLSSVERFIIRETPKV